VTWTPGFQGTRSKVNLQAAGEYCGGLPHSLFLWMFEGWDVWLATNRSILVLIRIAIRIQEFLTEFCATPEYTHITHYTIHRAKFKDFVGKNCFGGGFALSECSCYGRSGCGRRWCVADLELYCGRQGCTVTHTCTGPRHGSASSDSVLLLSVSEAAAGVLRVQRECIVLPWSLNEVTSTWLSTDIHQPSRQSSRPLHHRPAVTYTLRGQQPRTQCSTPYDRPI